MGRFNFNDDKSLTGQLKCQHQPTTTVLVHNFPDPMVLVAAYPS